MTTNQFLATWENGLVTKNPDALQDCAGQLAKILEKEGRSRTIVLKGDMGAGKTTFTQGLAAGWGIKQAVTSPTFNLLNCYRGESWTLLHLDAYRLRPGDATDVLLLDELKKEPWCLVIEWPENVPDLANGVDAIQLQLTAVDLDTPEPGRRLQWIPTEPY